MWHPPPPPPHATETRSIIFHNFSQNKHVKTINAPLIFHKLLLSRGYPRTSSRCLWIRGIWLFDCVGSSGITLGSFQAPVRRTDKLFVGSAETASRIRHNGHSWSCNSNCWVRTMSGFSCTFLSFPSTEKCCHTHYVLINRPYFFISFTRVATGSCKQKANKRCSS